MARTLNALRRGDLQAALSSGRKAMDKLNAEITGANSEPVKQAARVLGKEARRLVSVPFDGTPSSPGSPPEMRTKKLRKSIRTGVVSGVRRVGTDSFTARLLEFGVNTPPRPSRPKKRGRGTTTAHAGRVLEPRPFFRPALENVQQEMTDVFVSEAQKRVAKVP